jgi:hypothetical protein
VGSADGGCGNRCIRNGLCAQKTAEQRSIEKHTEAQTLDYGSMIEHYAVVALSRPPNVIVKEVGKMLVLRRRGIVRIALIFALSVMLIIGMSAVFQGGSAYGWNGYLEDCDFDGYDDETGEPVPWYGYDETHGDTIPADWDGVSGSYTDKHEESLKPKPPATPPPATGGNTGGGNTGGDTGSSVGASGANSGANTGGGNTGSGNTGGGNTGTAGSGSASTTDSADTTADIDTTETPKSADKTADKTSTANTAKDKSSAKATGAELDKGADKESGEKGGAPVALIIVGGIVVLGGAGGFAFWKLKIGKKAV